MTLRNKQYLTQRIYVSSDRLSSLSVAVTSILVHIDLHADVILCLRKFGQKTYRLNMR